MEDGGLDGTVKKLRIAFFKCINKQLPAGRVLEVALPSVEELSLSIAITVIEYLVPSCKLVKLYLVLALLIPVIVLETFFVSSVEVRNVE